MNEIRVAYLYNVDYQDYRYFKVNDKDRNFIPKLGRFASKIWGSGMVVIGIVYEGDHVEITHLLLTTIE